mmetsp:Transcript_2925/g.6531  ORF Transcript_2925/g.6531 Transcript_2925/m.6531 type:complete len:172 (-) Transcript_2925:83-598(-)
MYARTAVLSSYVSFLSKHVFVGEDDGKNEEDGKFDGCDVFDGGVDGVKLIDGGVDGAKLIDGMFDKLVDGAVDVSSTTVTISVLGDKSSGIEDLDNNTEITTTAATNMMQTNARNCLAFSCVYHGGTGSSGTPSYTGSFGTSVASSSSIDSSPLSFGNIDLGGLLVGSITA